MIVRSSRLFILLFLTLLLAHGLALAASIYIAPTGNDTTGNGSIGSPYLTLTKAGSVAVAGDTVYARGGTYTAVKQTITANGAVGNPVTFTEYPGEQAIFDGTGATFTGGDAILWWDHCNHVVVNGYEVRNALPTSTKVNAILLWECTDMTVQNCVCHEIGGAGVSLIGDTLTADSNEVYRAVLMNENNRNARSGWSCAIKCGQRADKSAPTNITFTNNYVHDVWGEGIDALMANGATVTGNTIVDPYSVCIYLDNACNVTVSNNVCYTTPTGEHRNTSGYLPSGIMMASERYSGWTSVPISNVQINNNLTYRTDHGIHYWYMTSSYNNLRIYYNTVVNPERTGFSADAVSSTSGNELKNNIIYSSYANGNVSGWVTSYNDWPTGMPTSGSHPNSFSANPQFVNPTQAGIPTGFKLNSGSPCISAGTPVSVTTDYWGTARSATTPTIGFAEYASGPPQPPVADFSGNPTSGAVPLTVLFTDLSTNSPTSWSWTFGDGGTSTAQSPSHQYTATGSYTVALTATNSAGSNTNTKTSYITVSAGGNPPVAQFVGSPTSGTAPLAVSFTDQSTNSPTSWSWTFGDGGTSTAQSPSHTYTTAGSYTVALTATNGYGNNTNTKTNYISVSAGGSSCHVGSIAMANASPPNYVAKATIVVHDQNHAPLAGVTVTGTWSGPVSGTRTGTTDATGAVNINSPRGGAGTYVFTVTSLAKTGYTYNSAANHVTSGSLTLP